MITSNFEFTPKQWMLSIWTLLFLLHRYASKPNILFPIMGLAPPYPKLATNNSFINTWQNIRYQWIRSPLYLSTYLCPVMCMHKFLQHCPTQQEYLPVKLPERIVSPKSVQGVLSLWYRVGTTSFPHNIIFITHCGSLDIRTSWKMTRTYHCHIVLENWRMVSSISKTSA